jgi:hypothetical protein
VGGFRRVREVVGGASEGRETAQAARHGQARAQAGYQLGETAKVAGKGKGCPGEQLCERQQVKTDVGGASEGPETAQAARRRASEGADGRSAGQDHESSRQGQGSNTRGGR